VRSGPSRTAWSAANHRAAHQIAEHGRIFTDPLAIPILGGEPVVDTEPGRRRMRVFIAARSAYAEAKLAQAYARGTRDVVILGAGLDTFAYRNPYPDLRVFEVDHPDTQAWKRERLASAAVTVPDSVTYVPVDFENESLADRLRVPDRTFFMWLGVVPYLTRAGFDETLAYVQGVPRPEVVFDYAMPPESLSPARRAAFAARAARVAGLGEPWQTYFWPDEIERILHAFGDLEDLGPAQLAERFFHRADLPPDTPGGHILHARQL
jgi:methyltransferase (TIGR00027 family)